MTVQKEKYIERKLVQAVQDRDGYCIKLGTQFLSGLPDRMCLLPQGRIVFVEVKETGKKPTKLQSVWASRLKALGFQVYTLDHTGQITEILDHAK